MNRLTARLLLVLLLVSVFAPAAMAVAAPLPHACCMRKPMHHHGREVQAVGGPHGNCCPPVTTAHWAEPGSGIDSSVHPLLAYLPPVAHRVVRGNQANTLQPVRGPPLS